MRFRRARPKDVPAISRLMGGNSKVLLPRPLPALYRDFREFYVADEGGVVGCGALRAYSRGLAEVRSLAVDGKRRGESIGTLLVTALAVEARSLGIKEVFALTTIPGFFTGMGFREVPLGRFPHKVFQDCTGCPRRTRCDEKAVSLQLGEVPYCSSSTDGQRLRNRLEDIRRLVEADLECRSEPGPCELPDSCTKHSLLRIVDETVSRFCKRTISC
jgi:amino-acid N-acetyltransferase